MFRRNENEIAPHIILGINRNSDMIKIKSAYKDLVKKFHPDKYKGNKDYAKNQFIRIDRAYKQMISKDYQDSKNNKYQKGVFYPNRNINRMKFNKNKNNNFYNPKNIRPPAQVLCNGTVLMTNGFHPSHLSYDMLQKMRNNLK
jgi:curved DNA-binding protein CbpA